MKGVKRETKKTFCEGSRERGRESMYYVTISADLASTQRTSPRDESKYSYKLFDFWSQSPHDTRGKRGNFSAETFSLIRLKKMIK